MGSFLGGGKMDRVRTFSRTCPQCGYRFVSEVRERVLRDHRRIVESVLKDFQGRFLVDECPGCGRESTVFNTLGNRPVSLGNSAPFRRSVCR